MLMIKWCGAYHHPVPYTQTHARWTLVFVLVQKTTNICLFGGCANASGKGGGYCKTGGWCLRIAGWWRRFCGRGRWFVFLARRSSEWIHLQAARQRTALMGSIIPPLFLELIGQAPSSLPNVRTKWHLKFISSRTCSVMQRSLSLSSTRMRTTNGP